MTRPLAIFGGTFDPIHIGHLTVAWEAAELLAAEVRLMPASVPPHRPPPLATPEERVAMLRAALAGQSRLTLDTRELDRIGPSWTIDTLRELRAEQGERPLILLLGADAFAGLPGWHEWRTLFDFAHIGVLSRPGVDAALPEALAQAVAARRVDDVSALRAAPAGKLVELSVTPLEISATRIRELLAVGRDPRYLLPAGLFDESALLRPYRHAQVDSVHTVRVVNAELFEVVKERLSEVLLAFEVNRAINDAYISDMDGHLKAQMDGLYACMLPIVGGLQMAAFTGVHALVEKQTQGNASLRRLWKEVQQKAIDTDLSWVERQLDDIASRYGKLRNKVYGHNDVRRQRHVTQFEQAGLNAWASIKRDIAELNYIFMALQYAHAGTPCPDRVTATSIKHDQDLLVDEAREAASRLVEIIRNANMPLL